MSISRIVTVPLLSAIFLLPVSADTYLSPLAEGYLQRGREMLEGGNYTGAIDQLRYLVTEDASLDTDDTRDLVYLIAMASYERGDSDCRSLLADFISRYPSSTMALEASLALADSYLYEKSFADALDAYLEIDMSRLNSSQKPLYKYRTAFCLIKCGEFDKAVPLLRSLEGDRNYRQAADFYLGYIYYVKGDYDQAYQRFLEVTRTRTPEQSSYRRSSLYVPTGLEAEYYLVHIEYVKANYGEVISTGKKLLMHTPVEELRPELEKVIGLSYFKLGDKGDARRYLQSYFDLCDGQPSDDAVYAMGVLEYDDADYDSASRLFSSISGLRSDLGQSASLFLGQIAAREGDDNAAAIAFERAASMVYDRNVGESALYNYVAARTRGGNIPFSSSISLLERFLEQYPQSEYAPAVEEYLATAYYNEKDYAKALESINRISHPGAKALAAKQKVTYELGVEALMDNRPSDAETFFREAIALSNHDAVIAQDARLWLADALYAQRKWNQAETTYKQYLDKAKNSSNRSLALYDMAYALYQQDKFSQAASWFRKALDATPDLPERLRSDASVRLADCRYYTGDYKGALTEYAAVEKAGGQDADYSAFRHAVMQGLGGNIKGKLSELTAMRSRYPESRWLPAALLEKGMTYSALGQTADATRAFEQLTNEYPSSPYARKGLLNLALAYSKTAQADRAAETYREVIRNWPSSEEASLANEDLRRYYASTGELDEYSEFLSSVPDAPRLGDDEKERLSYEAAESAFAANEADYRRLEEYCDRYPSGRYLAQALLDLAEGYDAADKKENALEALNRLLSHRADSPQAPEALSLKAQILEEIPARRGDALMAWKELERRADNDFLPDAYAGIMRTTDSEQERIKYARLALRSGGLSADMTEEANLYEAIGLRDSGDAAGAMKILSSLAANPKSVAGARAAVTLGQMQLDANRLKEAEKTLTDFTEAGTPHQYWLARGFIALADTYKAMGKTYLAKEYITSLRDNYPGSELDIHDMISKRLKSWK